MARRNAPINACRLHCRHIGDFDAGDILQCNHTCSRILVIDRWNVDAPVIRKERMKFFGWSVAWVVVYALAAAVLLILVLLTFNACLGRMPYYGLTIDAEPRSDLDGVMRGDGAARRLPGKGRYPADRSAR